MTSKEIAFNTFAQELERLKGGIEYCNECIAHATEKWVIKEYQYVIEDNKKRIAEIEEHISSDIWN
jgi:hypothetical protein